MTNRKSRFLLDMLQTTGANREYLDTYWLFERESASKVGGWNRKDKPGGIAPCALCARHQKKNVLPARSIDDEGRELLCRFGLQLHLFARIEA